MNAFLLGIAIFLLLNIIVGMVRLGRGPTNADRMLAVQLFGTTGVGIILLLAEAGGRPEFKNVALIFTLLAAIAAVAYATRGPSRASQQESER
ncbi:MAG: multiple resistance and pH regulation protein F [Phycisphaeraceae bacterium]|nr:MAG: multiple resistance and pH regulation protein F [Phycisphaeraceae bacterium]